MKPFIFTLLTVAAAVAQEKSAVSRSATPHSVTATLQQSATLSYSPADVKVLGDVDYGQTLQSWDRPGGARYRAFVFSGYGGDKVDIKLISDERRTFMALADSTLNLIGTGSSHMILSLPYRGTDIEVFYVLFPAAITGNTRVTVQVKKLSGILTPLAEIKIHPRESHRQGGLD